MENTEIKESIKKMKHIVEGGDLTIIDEKKNRTLNICRGVGGTPILEMPTLEWNEEEILEALEFYLTTDAANFDGVKYMSERFGK